MFSTLQATRRELRRFKEHLEDEKGYTANLNLHFRDGHVVTLPLVNLTREQFRKLQDDHKEGVFHYD